MNQFNAADLKSSNKFSIEFIRQVVESLVLAKPDGVELTETEKNYITKWDNRNVKNFESLDSHINEMCKNYEIVLMIDNANMSINNSSKVFSDFKIILKAKQTLNRRGETNTFKCVIFAGIYEPGNTDLFYLHYNPPLGIKMDFNCHLTFHEEEIEKMLIEYQTDNKTNMA